MTGAPWLINRPLLSVGAITGVALDNRTVGRAGPGDVETVAADRRLERIGAVRVLGRVPTLCTAAVAGPQAGGRADTAGVRVEAVRAEHAQVPVARGDNVRRGEVPGLCRAPVGGPDLDLIAVGRSARIVVEARAGRALRAQRVSARGQRSATTAGARLVDADVVDVEELRERGPALNDIAGRDSADCQVDDEVKRVVEDPARTARWKSLVLYAVDIVRHAAGRPEQAEGVVAAAELSAAGQCVGRRPVDARRRCTHMEAAHIGTVV